jgi:PAS domain-containing protein
MDRRALRTNEDATMTDRPDAPTSQLPIELILLKQVASYLDLPVFLIDAEGDLVYFNEPAEPLLGLRFDEVGELSMAAWLASFRPRDESGRILAEEAVPLVVALREARPVHAQLDIVGLDGVRRAIETTSVPLPGQGGDLLGAVALFWSAP